VPDTLLPTTAERRLARELASIRSELEAVKAGGRATQLDATSMLYPLVVRDPATGEVVGSIGQQGDGGVAVFPVGGPPPPKPSLPIVTPGLSVINVEWDGQFVGGAERPSNFGMIVVHVSGVGPNFITDPSNAVGYLSEPGTLPVGPVTGQQWVRFVGYNTSTPPVTGEASDTATGTPGQVVAQAVLDGIVNEVALANEAVSRRVVANAAIGSVQIGGQAVTLGALANAAVDARVLAGGAVTAPALGPLAVEGPAIAAEAVTAGKMAANSVEAGAIATNAVTAGKVAATTIGATELAANAVTAGKVAANAIEAGDLAANSVGATQLVAGAVQAGHLAAASVTAGALAAQSVTAGAMAANSVTAGALTAGAVTADKIAAVLSVASRFIAAAIPGATTGTRAEMNQDGFEAWKGSIQTFDVDADTGNVMMLGNYKTAQSGSRIEFGGSVGSDTIRFYPSAGSASARIDSFTDGSNAGILMQASGATSSKRVSTMFLRTNYASLGFADLELDTRSEFYAEPGFVRARSAVVDLIVDESLTASGGARRVAFIHYTSGGAAVGSSHMNYQEAANSRAWLWGVNANCGLKFDGAGLAATTGSSETFGPISASAFPANSSVARKEDVADVTIAAERSAWDIVEGAPAMDWNYIGENDRGPHPTNPDGSRVVYREPNPELTQREFRALPDDSPRKWVTRYSEWDFPAPQAVRHRFPLAEDLAELDAGLVRPADDPADAAVDIRDAIGTLWDAVDMLIKRTRVYDDLIAEHLPRVSVPPRPQRGDVAEGVGAVKPGRTRREIDPTTRQRRGRPGRAA
jgi:hypothetical protein